MNTFDVGSQGLLRSSSSPVSQAPPHRSSAAALLAGERQVPSSAAVAAAVRGLLAASQHHRRRSPSPAQHRPADGQALQLPASPARAPIVPGQLKRQLRPLHLYWEIEIRQMMLHPAESHAGELLGAAGCALATTPWLQRCPVRSTQRSLTYHRPS